MFDVVVLGSLNVDYVFETERLPRAGQTVMGKDLAIHPGGKGANQAVAAARMGAKTAMIGAVGKDANGDWLLAGLEKDGVDISGIERLDVPTGAAAIAVDSYGRNQIIVSPGANGRIDTDAITMPQGVGAVLTQHEVPEAAVDRFLQLAFEAGVPYRILNPAPARLLTEAEYRFANVFIPNGPEAEFLAKNTVDPGGIFLEDGFEHVILTLGAKGALYAHGELRKKFSAPKVSAVDTTAAGDVFCGALAAFLAEGMEMESAIKTAIRAASISVTRSGAQPSIPYRSEILS